MRDRGAEEGRGGRAREAERRESRMVSDEIGSRRGKERKKERKSVCHLPYCSINKVRHFPIFLPEQPYGHSALCNVLHLRLQPPPASDGM